MHHSTQPLCGFDTFWTYKITFFYSLFLRVLKFILGVAEHPYQMGLDSLTLYRIHSFRSVLNQICVCWWTVFSKRMLRSRRSGILSIILSRRAVPLAAQLQVGSEGVFTIVCVCVFVWVACLVAICKLQGFWLRWTHTQKHMYTFYTRHPRHYPCLSLGADVYRRSELDNHSQCKRSKFYFQESMKHWAK